jgi:hypothetical protein
MTGRIHNLAKSSFQDRQKITVTEWCERNIVFAEAENKGPFRILAREYQREWLDSFSDKGITDGVIVKGTQVGGTSTFMAGLCWAIAHEPMACMWVMPSITKGDETSNSRFMPMIQASPGVRHLIPSGKDRYKFKTKQYQIGGSLVLFKGSNSPSAISSTPCSVVIQDEMEKFDTKATGEAGTSRLADARVDNCPNPKRYKDSTPAMSDGLIWEALLTTDLRRWFVPCPHCQRRIVLAWSKLFTMFDLTGNEAFVSWDKEAKRPNRNGLDAWDLDRVEKSAAFICPHCAGRILDRHKTFMDRNGGWQATKTAERGRVGWHFPSMYSSAVSNSFGKLAVEFLRQKHSLEGCQDFINRKLAEPYNAQDTIGERTELVKKAIETFNIKETTDSPKKLMTVDCQFNAPYFWYIIQVWTPDETQIIEASHCDTWVELEDIQKRHETIPDRWVMVDSGFGAKSDAEVYRNCARHCQPVPRRDKVPLLLGWMPSKGMPGGKRWKNEAGVLTPWTMREIDPFIGTADAGVATISLFEYGSDYMKDILDTMRKNKSFVKIKWSVAGDKGIDLNVFWKHMDAEHKIPNYKTRSQSWRWEPRSKSGGWPNHLFDCAVMQLALANSLNLVRFT